MQNQDGQSDGREEAPSVRLCIEDAVLAFTLDRVLTLALRNATDGADDAADEEIEVRDIDQWQPGDE